MKKWEYDFGGDVPVLTVLKTCTLEEAFEALDGMIGHLDFPPGSNLIVDLTGSATKRVYGEAEAVAHRLGRYREKGRLGPLLVFVVAKPHQYGLVRQGSVFAEKYGLHTVLCYDFQEALKWASVEHPDSEGP